MMHDDAVAVVGNSWIARTVERCFNLVPFAWRTSATRAWLEASLGTPHSRVAESVRLAGWAGLSAIIVHVLLVGIGDLLQPPMGGLIWLAAVPLALACIRAPQAVLAAWNSSRLFTDRN